MNPLKHGNHAMQKLLAALAASLILTACATTPSAPTASAPEATVAKSPEEIVAERSLARWQLLIAGRLGEAYDYLTPGARSEMTREEYVENYTGRPVRWRAAEVESVECEDENVCMARVMLTIETHMQMVGAVKTPAHVRETWLRVDGDWFRLPNPAR